MTRPSKKTNRSKHSQQGFIALMSVIIISIILLVIASTFSFSNFHGRENVLDWEFKEKSLALAEACVDTAIFYLWENLSYSPGSGEIVPVSGSEECIIRGVDKNTPSTNQITIKTEAGFQSSFTYLEIVLDALDLSIISWTETPN